jgi:NlpC/P60 family putative phage cell wall peptidase
MIVAEARSWIGTPYHHQARAKGVGVDCAGLVIGIARELGMVAPDFDISGYARRPDGWSFLSWSDQHMRRIPRAQMGPGSCVVVRFDQHPQHIGIVGDYVHGGLSIIHAIQGRGVVETRLMLDKHMIFVAAYELPKEGAWRNSCSGSQEPR